MPTHLLQTNDLVGTRYKIMDFIGEGGMQQVYKATDTAFGRLVVVKIPKNPSAERRFNRSAEMSARVNHPNVAKTLDYIIGEKSFYLVEEYVPGQDLQARLNIEFYYLDPHLAAHLIHHVAKGLAACHHAGVFHRDLKPSNIIVSSDPGFKTLKLTDFGIAKMAGVEIDEAIEGGEDTTTASSTAVGALPYMAPENFADSKSANTPADVWSVGAMLYYLVTGEKPFGNGWLAIATIIEAKLPDKAKFFKFKRYQFEPLLEALWEVITMCLRKDPLHRPKADELVQRIAKICYSTAERKIGHIYNYALGMGAMNYGFISSAGEEDCFFHKDSFFGKLPENQMKVNFAPFHGKPDWRAFPVLPLRNG
jgi:serine/threonine protein kinase